jgi:hypothetical protein
MINRMPAGALKSLKGIKEFIENALLNLMAAHDAIIASWVNQTHHTNRRRRPEEPWKVNDLVYLLTENLNLLKGWARKLMPKFIGPYRVVNAFPESSTYELDLPEGLKKHRINARFHATRLRKHEPNDDVLFPNQEDKVWYDFGDDEEEEWLVDAITGHCWIRKRIEFEVRWNLGDTTWELIAYIEELEALDAYLAVQGETDWRKLPRREGPVGRKKGRRAIGSGGN